MAAYEHAMLIRKDNVGEEHFWILDYCGRQMLEDLVGLPLVDALNHLGKDEWQYTAPLNSTEHILKREL